MACILVVEDDQAVRDVVVEFLGEFLGERGYEILAAASAGEAREAMAARSVELAISDCVLYGEQGEAFARYASTAGVPAILMTGDGARLMAARKQGFLVLRKPFHLAELAELIVHLLGAAGEGGIGEACRDGTGGG